MLDGHRWIALLLVHGVHFDPVAFVVHIGIDLIKIVHHASRSNCRRRPVGLFEQVVPRLRNSELARIQPFDVHGEEHVDHRVDQHQQQTEADVQWIVEDIRVQLLERGHDA